MIMIVVMSTITVVIITSKIVIIENHYQHPHNHITLFSTTIIMSVEIECDR